MRSTKIKDDKIYDVDAYQEDGMGDVIETVGAGATALSVPFWLSSREVELY